MDLNVLSSTEREKNRNEDLVKALQKVNEERNDPRRPYGVIPAIYMTKKAIDRRVLRRQRASNSGRISTVSSTCSSGDYEEKEVVKEEEMQERHPTKRLRLSSSSASCSSSCSSSSSPSASSPSSSSSARHASRGSAMWPCGACTVENTGGSDVCSLCGASNSNLIDLTAD